MFWIEMEHDETLITILDDSGELDDVSVLLYDDYCHIRQWNESEGAFNIITLKAEMYFELMKAWNLPVGGYTIVKSNQQD
jgi:hypothetical protein